MLSVGTIRRTGIDVPSLAWAQPSATEDQCLRNRHRRAHLFLRPPKGHSDVGAPASGRLETHSQQMGQAAFDHSRETIWVQRLALPYHDNAPV